MKDLIQRLRDPHWSERELSLRLEAADALERLTAGDVELPEPDGTAEINPEPFIDQDSKQVGKIVELVSAWSETLVIDYGNRRAAAAVLAERARKVKPVQDISDTDPNWVVWWRSHGSRAPLR